MEIGVEPIQGRVVEHGQDGLLVAGVHELPYEITAAGGVRSVVGVQSAGIVEGKALVMAGGQGNVPCAGGLGDADDAAGVKLRGGEGILQLDVLLLGDAVDSLDPLALAQLGVQPPMDE